VTTVKKGIEVMKENNTANGTNDAAIFNMETHTLMNRKEKSVGCW